MYIYIWIDSYIHVWLYIYIYSCMYIYIYYIHTWNLREREALDRAGDFVLADEESEEAEASKAV